MLACASTAAFAAPHLTPQECNAYPFVHTQREVTHADLVRELIELEQVGYNPAHSGPYYPDDLDEANRRLATEYRTDCTHALTADANPH
ncbi:DUF4148 domain-containing protein [Burkholderia cepacia]|nr:MULTISPECIES: DUF4148 domain-containing protein [Burkholderia cepacia complex]MBR8396679.1 DUF4148 domain-containing protein [Burkholderia cenocepacia]MDN7639233.1 DUF4148 domain-containing protein [Burkholderia cepacia]UIY61886.1 DUF4148 domain-containing protein [Burkholderia cepacia]UJH77510.1 DUF4148 domain-containing protein [Burkholderia cenocepacia]